jgi:hypothetical protein
MFKLAIRPMLGRHLDSMSRMEDFLEKECQDIDYTIVRPPRLIDGHIIGKAFTMQIVVCHSTRL